MQDFISLFDASFQRISDSKSGQRDFFAAFYDRFLACDERVRTAFASTDMDAQRSMIKKSFFYMASFYATSAVPDYVEKIAKSHNRFGYNVDPDLYDIWLEALMGVLKDFDPAYSEEVELAWRLVLAPGITYMKFCHEK